MTETSTPTTFILKDGSDRDGTRIELAERDHSDLSVGDVIATCVYYERRGGPTYQTIGVDAIETITKIETDGPHIGAHFAGGSYIAPDDSPVVLVVV